MSIAQELSINVMRAAVEQAMQQVLQMTDAPPDPFWGMMHYHMGWVDAGWQRGGHENGKRIRPILCLLTCAAAGGDWRMAVPAGAALEILHNFSLVHDDIEDDSPLRRGRPTVWRVWGAPQAINTGDAMFAVAHLALVRLREQGVVAEVVVRAIRRFDETCLALTRGQYHDMRFETSAEVSVAEYLAMIEGKTAALTALSAEMGALVADADDERAQHFAQFGLELGLAFQVRDDWLGIWGDEAQIGKSAESDILTKKKTLPVLYGLGRSPELRDLYRQPADTPGFVAAAIQLLDACGARAYTQERAAHHSERALFHLDQARPSGDAGQALYALADQLLNRRT